MTKAVKRAVVRARWMVEEWVAAKVSETVE